MRCYLVPIMNRETDQQIMVEVWSAYPVEAQVQALHDTFHAYGWRHIKAGLARVKEDEQAA